MLNCAVLLLRWGMFAVIMHKPTPGDHIFNDKYFWEVEESEDGKISAAYNHHNDESLDLESGIPPHHA